MPTKGKKDELHYEQKANALIRKNYPLWCYHVETSVPGFPDTVVTGRQTVFIEYKVGEVEHKLINTYEPAQLRVHRDLHKAGAFVLTALVSPKHEDVMLFESGEFLNDAMQMLDVRFSDFLFSRFVDVESFASVVAQYVKGELTRERFLLR